MNKDNSFYWVDVDPSRGSLPPTAGPVATGPVPMRSRARTGPSVGLVMLGAFLIDTFLPWQRVCLNVTAFGISVAGCLGANAWSGTAAHVGQAAGVLAIVAIVVAGLRLGGVDLGDGGELAVRVGVYGTAAAGGLKWILVIGKFASFGAWLGILLLLAIAILESVRWLSFR